MVCFCDIPLSRISEHTELYGSYGLGLTKQWAEKNSLNPVLYISPNSGLRESILESMNLAAKSSEEIDEYEANPQMDETRFLIAHIKPTSGKMKKNERSTVRDFYQESEWRYIPRNSQIMTHLTHSEFNDTETIDISNYKSKKNCSLKVTPKDVAYIFVPTDLDIPKVIRFIGAELGEFSNNDLMVLYSRIVSIETLNGDM